MNRIIRTEYLGPPEENNKGYDVTLCVDTTELPKTKKVPKDADDEAKEKIREQNDEIRKVIYKLPTNK